MSEFEADDNELHSRVAAALSPVIAGRSVPEVMTVMCRTMVILAAAGAGIHQAPDILENCANALLGAAAKTRGLAILHALPTVGLSH